MQIHEKQTCRICGNSRLITVIDLGTQALSGRFPKKDDPDPPLAPLVLVKCDNEKDPKACGLVQLKHTVDPGEMYGKEYGYRSGINTTMSKHLAGIVELAKGMVGLNAGDIVLDIGSNDGTLLKSYHRSDIRRIGIDPGGEQFQKYYPADIRLVSDFFTAENFTAVFPGENAKIITSIAMFYDLEEPMAFVRNISEILHPEGGWILEQSYLPTMLEMNSFDTICHEHLEYYAFFQIEWMLKKNGLKAIGIDFNFINGGSFRVCVTHAGSSIQPDTAALQKVRARERDLRLETMEPYRRFCIRVGEIKALLTDLLRSEKAAGKKIYVYG
ncbi:class I SAM-dependent methyltransferase, partial [Methanoregula sp.]|uniref:class I SAM-dependent methyltransferase n=1 Tax=Methanoregula sp. TaxID=2052170 RepID=UPI000CC4FD27